MYLPKKQNNSTIQKFWGLLFPNLITCEGIATQRPLKNFLMTKKFYCHFYWVIDTFETWQYFYLLKKLLWFSSVLLFNLTFHHGNLEMKGLNKATLAFCNRYQTNLDKSSLVILLLAKSLQFKKGVKCKLVNR